MSTNENIMFTKEVMAELRYRGMSAFYDFLKGENDDFPQPFKIGRRNTWYTEDVKNWMKRQREKSLN